MTRDELTREHPDLVAKLQTFRGQKGLEVWPSWQAFPMLPAGICTLLDEVMLLAIPSHLRASAVSLVDRDYARDFVERFNVVVEEYLDWVADSGEERMLEIDVDFAVDLAVQAGFDERYEPAVKLER